jgi:hypothetical protein
MQTRLYELFFALAELMRGRAYLAADVDVPKEGRSADEAGEDPKGKSRQAEPGRWRSILKMILQTLVKF